MLPLFLLSGSQLIKHAQPSTAVQALRALKPKLLGVATIEDSIGRKQETAGGGGQASKVCCSPRLSLRPPLYSSCSFLLKAGYRSLGLSCLCCWH